MISCEAMTPGEIKARGKGVSISYGITGTPFGPALIGWTPRGVCHLSFCDDNCTGKCEQLLAAWPAASPVREDAQANRLAETIFPAVPQPGKLHLVLRGTNFQIKVWEALLNIGPSQLVSYTQLAGLDLRRHRAR